MLITFSHVQKRFSDFLTGYRRALVQLGYSQDVVVQNCQHLQQRLEANDFKVYGTAPSHVLHGGKRVTRFLIKLAIEQCPAQRARRERLHARYSRECAEVRVYQPSAQFFSFEAAYATQLKVKLSDYKSLFRL